MAGLMLPQVCHAQIAHVEDYFPLCEGTEWHMTQEVVSRVMGPRNVNGTTGTVVQINEDRQETYVIDEDGLKLLERRFLRNDGYYSAQYFDPPILLIHDNFTTGHVETQEFSYYEYDTNFPTPLGPERGIRSAYILSHLDRLKTGIGQFEDVLEFVIEISLHTDPPIFIPPRPDKTLPRIYTSHFWLTRDIGFIKYSDWDNLDPLEIMAATICNTLVELESPIELPNLRPSFRPNHRSPVGFSMLFQDPIYGDYYFESDSFDEDDDIYVSWAVRNDWVTSTPVNQSFDVSLLIDGRPIDTWTVEASLAPWEQYISDQYLIEQPLSNGWHDVELRVDQPGDSILELNESDNIYTAPDDIYVTRRASANRWAIYE
jgi:hypothetical protein